MLLEKCSVCVESHYDTQEKVVFEIPFFSYQIGSNMRLEDGYKVYNVVVTNIEHLFLKENTVHEIRVFATLKQ